jgi:hypothetical protein
MSRNDMQRVYRLLKEAREEGLYVGDFDPSGLYMSEEDLPYRLYVDLQRVALTRDHVADLPSFPATDKKKDTRYSWFHKNYGDRCWELTSRLRPRRHRGVDRA